jgi:hypothetical protein
MILSCLDTAKYGLFSFFATDRQEIDHAGYIIRKPADFSTGL